MKDSLSRVCISARKTRPVLGLATGEVVVATKQRLDLMFMYTIIAMVTAWSKLTCMSDLFL